jgi:hypothetical protein
MIRITLLTVNTTAAAGVAGLFIWGLRGVHRFPYETALFAIGLEVIFFANLIYVYRKDR